MSKSKDLRELFCLFGKLGLLGFGGPAAHIAFMDEEVVERRGWLDRQRFLDLVGATNLIPGPNSTEMAIHIGYARAGFAGLVVAGLSFLVPSVVLTICLAWGYVTYQQTPQLQAMLTWVNPVVVAVIGVMGWRLGWKIMTTWEKRLLTFAALAAAMIWDQQLLLLIVTGLVALVVIRSPPRKPVAEDRQEPPATPSPSKPSSTRGSSILWPLGLWLFFRDRIALASEGLAAGSQHGSPFIPQVLLQLGFFFLKVGFILYGSGYVLFAFLESEVVGRNQWVTQSQLVDAIAAGQITPGPILSTSAFIGYLVGAGEGGAGMGVAGAIIAAGGIFLPSFILVAITAPYIARMRKSQWVGRFLDGVNAGSLGLMGAVVLKLAATVFYSVETEQFRWLSIMVAVGCVVVIQKIKLNPLWLVLAALAAGAIQIAMGWG